MKKLLIYMLGLVLVTSACTDVDLEDQEIILEDLPAYVAFRAPGEGINPDITRNERSAPAAIVVEAPTGSLSDITVNYSFGGSAVFGTDYTVSGATAAGGTVVIEDDPTIGDFDNASITVTFLTDAVNDGTKELIISLVSAVDADGNTYAVGRGGTDFQKNATVTITDVPWTLTGFASTELSAMENSSDTTRFTVALNYAFPQDVTVDVSSSGTLVQGVDFQFDGLMGQLTIPAGQSSASFGIVNLDDNLVEGEDSLLFVISNPSTASSLNLTFGGADSAVFYQDDESKLLALSVAGDSIAFNSVNDAGFYEYDLMLANESDQMVSIDYTIVVSGGVAGVDYVDETGGTVVFEPGQTKSPIVIQILSAAFANASNISLDISVDGASLATSDAEVEVATDLSFEVNVINE